MAKSWGYKLHEWRDLPEEDRDLLLAHDLLVCSRCGNLRSVCSDPTLDWHAHTATCWPSATVDWTLRRMRERDSKAKVDDDALRETDGVTVFASQTEAENDPNAR